MPVAAAVAGAIFAGVGAVATVSQAAGQRSQARRQADLARRNAAVQNRAQVQAANTARERANTARTVDANQAAAAAETGVDTEVVVDDTNPTERRRQTRSAFRFDEDAATQNLRV